MKHRLVVTVAGALLLLVVEAVLPTRLAQRGPSILLYVFAVLAFVVALRYPWAGIMLLLAYGPFAPAVRFAGASSLDSLLKDLFALAIVGFWVVRSLLKREQWVRTSLDVPLVLFVALMVLQALRGPSLLRALLAIKVLATYIPIYFLVVNNPPTRRQLRRVLWVVMGVAAITAAYGLYQNVTFEGRSGLQMAIAGQSFLISSREDRLRVFSTFSHSTVFSLYLSLIITLGVAFLPIITRWRRVLLASVVGLSVAVLPLTLSRIGWIGSVLGVVTLSLLSWRGSQRLRILLVVVVGAFVFLAAATPETRETLDWSFTEQDVSFQNRQIFAGWSYRTLLTEVPGGCGMGVLPDSADLAGRITNSVQPAYTCMVSGGRFMQAADTVILAVAAQTGIPGYLLYTWIFVSLWRGGWRAFRRLQDPELRRLAAGLLGVLAIMTLSNYLSGSTQAYPVVDLYFWFFAGLLMSLERIEARELHPVGETPA